MAREHTIPHVELAELLDWLEKADSASSYDGFRFFAWISQRPLAAIQTLCEYRDKEA